MNERFRKKSVVIDALRFDGHNHAEVSAFMGCECGFGNPVREDCPYDHSKAGPKAIFIRTLEGDHRAIRGDWIIRGVKGEFYPCKPDIFEQTYEPASTPTAPALDAEETVTLYRAAAMNGEERRVGPWTIDQSEVAHLGEEVQQADFVPVDITGLDAENRERLERIAADLESGEIWSTEDAVADLRNLASRQQEPDLRLTQEEAQKLVDSATPSVSSGMTCAECDGPLRIVDAFALIPALGAGLELDQRTAIVADLPGHDLPAA